MIMRRVATAVLVLLVTASASAGTAIAARAPPGASPLKRAGRDFKPHESVRVRVVSGTRTSTPAGRASRGGRFPR